MTFFCEHGINRDLFCPDCDEIEYLHDSSMEPVEPCEPSDYWPEKIDALEIL